jgi:exonuclease SbcC
MNRLKSLFVKDFRSIDGEVSVSLDAPIVLIHGPNGAGKTSLLSAIELALTGAVPSLARAEPDYLSYLTHKDRPFGEVRLEIADENGHVRSSDIRVTGTAISGNPLLNAREATFFSERSYLAQSTLGRLLEIYQHADKKSDSPLTRFVKELLGLDRMEALIGGLYSAGNIARLKTPVPAYGSARDEIAATEMLIAELGQQETDANGIMENLDGRLRECLIAVDLSLFSDIDNLPALLDRLSNDPDEHALADLIRARREASVARQSWSATVTATDENARSALAAANTEAQATLDRWTTLNGARLEALLGRAAALFADISLSSESGYSERGRLLSQRIESDSARVVRVLAAHETSLQQRDALARQLDEARSRLVRQDEEITNAVETNGSIAKCLADLGTHIHDEICPVCDRDYSEVSGTPLSAHVAAKVAAIVEQAGRLQSLSQGRSQASAQIARLDRELQALSSQILSDTELNPLKGRAADLTEIGGQLKDAFSDLREGDRLRGTAAGAARSVMAIQNADQSAVVLKSNLEELAQRAGAKPTSDMSTEALLEAIEATIKEREEFLTARQTARRTARATVEALLSADRRRLDVQMKLQNARSDLATKQHRKAQADKAIDIAKEVARQTREARGRVVRRVFNDELNAVWRDLFVRLAPEEPFIPAFAIPEGAWANIEAVLETHHRRGGKGGNPRAMLSAGNLNTAALTLFLALHLSVKAKLPWLVIDDPVQSMDEVHIAQFAALLRTLSKQMQRQVIIAVHERSLFDYLSLELSPAFEGDRLNVIEIGRNAIGQTTSRWDPKTYVADRAIAA